jgi:hypothetical protein
MLIVAPDTTLLDTASITFTVPERELVTYNVSVDESIAISLGPSPIVIFSTLIVLSGIVVISEMKL